MSADAAADRRAPGWLRVEDCHLDDLLEVLAERTDEADYPHADRIVDEVVVYSADAVRKIADSSEGRREVQAEIARALADGPGIVVLEGAFDRAAVDRVSGAFRTMIDQEKRAGTAAGDHFAKPGANDRVWNALEKLAILDPEAFVDYYANDLLTLTAEAWLGPAYQVTSQVNVVNPGGAGQTVHRDYHLGFQSPEASARYPAHVHALSPALTLQGAVAHVDMPVESGPTLYLPHSQKYPHGYLAYWQPEFAEYFIDHHIQLPMGIGDAVFFNPALFHAAGSNHSGAIRRMANLLQISSAFGRAMETVDRERVVNAIYPTLLDRMRSGAALRSLDDAVAAAAEGYAFPTNLDRDQPVDGMAPPGQADVVRDAVASELPPADLRARLAAMCEARLTS